MELLQPQRKHGEFLLDSIYKNGISLDTSDTGTGKTYVAIWMAKQLNCPVMVICPVSVRYTWQELLIAAGITNFTLINYELLMRGNTEYLSYDLNLFHQTNDWWKSDGVEFNVPLDTFIIVDELHRCRGQKSLNGELVTKLKNMHYKVHAMTATLATSVADMKHTGYLLNLHGGYDYLNWCFDHGARYNSYGSIIMDGDLSLAKGGMKRIYNNLYNIQKISSRMRRSDFKGIFPDNRFITEIFDLGANNAKVNSVYENMQRELALLDKHSKNYKAHVFGKIIKARRQAELLKVPRIVEWIESTFDENISPVVFVNFVDTIEAIAARLNKPKYKNLIGYLHGDQSKQDRKEDIQDFQADVKRIFIANASAGSDGIGLHDLHGKYPRSSLICPSWSAFNLIQSAGRIPRVNGKSPCIQYFFYAKVTIEIKMAKRMKNRTANLEYLNEGDITDKDLIYEINI
jgi:hypothetical protein